MPSTKEGGEGAPGTSAGSSPGRRARCDETIAEKAQPEVMRTPALTVTAGLLPLHSARHGRHCPALQALGQAPGCGPPGLPLLSMPLPPPPRSQHQAPLGVTWSPLSPHPLPWLPRPPNTPVALASCSASSPLPTRSHVRCWAGAAMPKLYTGCRPLGPFGPDLWAIGCLSWPHRTRTSVPAPSAPASQAAREGRECVLAPDFPCLLRGRATTPVPQARGGKAGPEQARPESHLGSFAEPHPPARGTSQDLASGHLPPSAHSTGAGPEALPPSWTTELQTHEHR